jgi:hypothetical protein
VYLYFVVLNAYDTDLPAGVSPTGLRVEFFDSSFN